MPERNGLVKMLPFAPSVNMLLCAEEVRMNVQSARSFMTRIHATLGYDPVRNRSEFKFLFESLIEDAEVPPLVMALKLGYDYKTIYGWMCGISIPDEDEWPKITRELMSLLENLLVQDI